MKLLLTLILACTGILTFAQEENLAKGKTAKASSVENQKIKPEFALDGKKKTKWSSRYRNDPQWFCVDLGEVKKVGKVIIHWENNSAAKDYKIQLSEDGKKWTDAVWKKDGKGGTENLVFPQQNARFVRFSGQFRLSPANVYGFTEFQVFEK